MVNQDIYIVLDSPVYSTGELAEVYIVSHATVEEKLDVEFRDYKGVFSKASIKLEPGVNIVYTLEYQTPRIPGRYEIRLVSGSRLLDSVKYIVYGDALESIDRYIVLTWHHHQAPGYLPNGKYRYTWAFKHVADEELAPYGRGPYHYHAIILEKYRDYKCTYNLSPSLLAQWHQLITRGVQLENGEWIPSNSKTAELVLETLELYRKSVERGQIDVLTSIYAHTIGGFLVDYLGMNDIVRDEVAFGIEVTRSIIGVEPRGIWTPEMAFSMKMIDIYSELGLEYTVLDGKCHFTGSQGDKSGHLEPYIARGGHGEIIVFFRDTDLSNHLSFKNNFKNEAQAWRAAYELAYLIAEKTRMGGVLTIALDGENWMIFASNPPLTAFYYDKLVEYLVKIQSKNYFETSNHREIINKYSAKRILTHIPTTTWLCGFTKWNGEVRRQPHYWEKARKTYQELRNYEEKHGRDEYSQRARWALWHALDSDYWWAEFWDPTYIDTWLCEVQRHLLEGERVKNNFSKTAQLTIEECLEQAITGE